MMDLGMAGPRVMANTELTAALRRELLTYDLHDTLDPLAIIEDMERYAATRELFDFSLPEPAGIRRAGDAPVRGYAARRVAGAEGDGPATTKKLFDLDVTFDLTGTGGDKPAATKELFRCDLRNVGIVKVEAPAEFLDVVRRPTAPTDTQHLPDGPVRGANAVSVGPSGATGEEGSEGKRPPDLRQTQSRVPGKQVVARVNPVPFRLQYARDVYAMLAARACRPPSSSERKSCGLASKTAGELRSPKGTHPAPRCRFCSMLLNTAADLALHEASHVKYRCRFCSLLVDTTEQLTLHEASHVKYRCRFCGFLLDTSKDLAVHEASHVKYQCRFCGLLVDTSEQLALHEASHVKYQCRFCSFLLDTSEDLTRHEASHVKYQCRFCDLLLNTPEEVAVHAKSHVKYKCTYCGLLLDTSEELVAHENTHGRPTLHPCKFCSSFQGTLQNLQIHESLQHGKCRIPRK